MSLVSSVFSSAKSADKEVEYEAVAQKEPVLLDAEAGENLSDAESDTDSDFSDVEGESQSASAGAASAKKATALKIVAGITVAGLAGFGGYGIYKYATADGKKGTSENKGKVEPQPRGPSGVTEPEKPITDTKGTTQVSTGSTATTSTEPIVPKPPVGAADDFRAALGDVVDVDAFVENAAEEARLEKGAAVVLQAAERRRAAVAVVDKLKAERKAAADAEELRPYDEALAVAQAKFDDADKAYDAAEAEYNDEKMKREAALKKVADAAKAVEVAEKAASGWF